MQILAGVAFAILLIAGVNYAILVAAQATKRGRDIAIRRVHGASPFKIAILQILESCLFVAAAGILALILVPVIQANAVQIGFTSPPSTQHTLIPILLILILVIGSLAALLPTSLLLKFRPATLLGSRNLPDIPKGRILRTALVALQFSIATGLLLCTVIMILQIRHAQTLDPGYTPTGLLVLEGIRTDSVKQSLPTLQALIEDTPRVIGVTATSLLPASENESNLPVRKPGGKQIQIGWAAVDPAFFDTMQIPIVAGRDLTRDYALDDVTISELEGGIDEAALARRGGNVIASMSAIKRLGFSDPAAASGQQIDIGLVDLTYGLVPMTIIGIVDDVRYRSLRDPIRPMIYFQSRESARYLLVRARPGEETIVLGKIRDIWTRLFPDQPFSGRLLGQEVAALHAEDTTKTKTLAFFTILAIALACSGIYGTVAFSVERRRKEVAIHKIVGANRTDMLHLITLQILKPILFANILTLPVAWWAMRHWLDGFENRIDLSPTLFLATALGTAALGLLIVTGHVLNIARTPPAHALRTE